MQATKAACMKCTLFKTNCYLYILKFAPGLDFALPVFADVL